MTLKLVIFACLISMALAGILPTYIPPVQHYLPPATTTQASWKLEPIWKPVTEKPANFEFSYEVNEPKTGDIKQQFEKAVDGVIKGQYWLIEPDGSKRIVDYTADDKNGFQATVKLIPAQTGWKPAPTQWKPEHRPWNGGYYY
ncbi:hypothetical protein ACKWTF_001965 [Chironomus riparius]